MGGNDLYGVLAVIMACCGCVDVGVRVGALAVDIVEKPVIAAAGVVDGVEEPNENDDAFVVVAAGVVFEKLNPDVGAAFGVVVVAAAPNENPVDGVADAVGVVDVAPPPKLNPVVAGVGADVVDDPPPNENPPEAGAGVLPKVNAIF